MVLHHNICHHHQHVWYHGCLCNILDQLVPTCSYRSNIGSLLFECKIVHHNRHQCEIVLKDNYYHSRSSYCLCRATYRHNIPKNELNTFIAEFLLLCSVTVRVLCNVWRTLCRRSERCLLQSRLVQSWFHRTQTS